MLAFPPDQMFNTADQLSSFLMHLRLAYRASNSYHNFQHALDVFQATHMYLRCAGVVPPVAILRIPASDPRGKWRPHHEVPSTWVGILTKEDIFALYIAAIGHDVGHPGFNNIFMVRNIYVYMYNNASRVTFEKTNTLTLSY